jgi:hypothetical protein
MTSKYLQNTLSAMTDADKAALFEELLRQIALDNIALLWGNRTPYSGEALVSALQESCAVRLARVAEQSAPAGEDMPVQAYQFEAIAYAATRADFARLEALSSVPDPQFSAMGAFAALEQQFAAFGFTGLEEAYVTEDDEQGDTDIKLFVCVRVRGRSNIVENEVPAPALAQLLAAVAQPVCKTADGLTEVVPDDWELASIDDPEGAPAQVTE